MCKFCDLLKNSGTLIWKERSTFADDNLCEYASENSGCVMCDDCGGCHDRGFELDLYNFDDQALMRVSYYRKVCDVTVSTSSETMPFSFCPFCGEQVSKNIKGFNENDWRYSVKEDRI